jgi:hypothetical protein
MPKTRLALAEELAAIRDEIALLRRRERTLASLAPDFPRVSVFRPPLPMKRAESPGEPSHV